MGEGSEFLLLLFRGFGAVAYLEGFQSYGRVCCVYGMTKGKKGEEGR